MAQPADDATTRAARARFQEGVEAYDKGSYENARASFLQAYVLQKHPAVLLRLALLSCGKANHPLEASKYFQQFLRESSNLTAEKRAEAERGLAEVRQKLGRLEVSAPTGADIFVDNERMGAAPLTEAVDVDPGAHTVVAKGGDGGPVEQKVSVAAGQKLAVRLSHEAKVEPPKVVEPPKNPDPPKVTDPPKNPDPPVTDPGKDISPPPPDQGKKKGILSPPDTMIPVYIGLGVGGVGLIGTIVFAVAKGSAQSSADDVAAKLRAAGAQSGECSAPRPNFASACATLRDNVDAVNTDATVANVSAVVMVVGLVGAGAWYLFGPKTNGGSATASGKSAAAKSVWQRVEVAPVLAPRTGGLTVSGAF